jgi:hypothetical protein
MVHPIVTAPPKMVYSQIAKLVGLITYAQQHGHPQSWIPAILTIVERRGMAHG